MIRTCKKCNNEFYFNVRSQRFCDNCKILVCEVCGKTYFAKRAAKIFAQHKYCSKTCSIKGAVNTRWSGYKYKIREKKYTAFDKPDFYYDGYPVCIGNGSPCIKANGRFRALHIYVWEKYHR